MNVLSWCGWWYGVGRYARAPGNDWLEEADEFWVFGETISEGMAEEIEKDLYMDERMTSYNYGFRLSIPDDSESPFWKCSTAIPFYY